MSLAAIAIAIAGCGTTSSQSVTTAASGEASLGQPIATAPTTTATSSTTTATEINRPATTTSPAEWIRLPPPPSATARRSRAIVRVATQFASAFLLYQIGPDPHPVQQAIREACTRGFASLLLSQPVNVPSTRRSGLAEQPSELGTVTYTGPASLGPARQCRS